MVPEIRSETDRIFDHLDHFLPFNPPPPPNKPENQNFEKMKKESEDNIILHTRTKNHDHMMHAS